MARTGTTAGPAGRSLMLQGTGSDVGKSLLVAGLCRAFTRRGLQVRPFKPQNMSNNAAVTADGGEIGRAQALQARACGVPPSVHMNPVLLKPEGERGAQIVLQGRVAGHAEARSYRSAATPRLLAPVLDSFARLRDEADLVLVEGAGSPAEVNLRQGDIANMGFAEAADLPVVLVGDIDRGGVIASLVGTWAVLPPDERTRLKGYLINKLRGDATLFEPALPVIAGHTGLNCLGVVPFFDAAGRLPAEDSVALDRPAEPVAAGSAPIRVAVPRLPRIANFDDLDPLAAEPGVALRFIPRGTPIPPVDLVVLPGSKATRSDLQALRDEGWDIDIRAHLRRGGRVIGLCGGYQMLGRRVADPEGLEGAPGSTEGLGLLDVETVLAGPKTLRETVATEQATGASVAGYEIHLGRTAGPDTLRPMLCGEGGWRDGARSADGRAAGCYLHGLFVADAYRHALLAALRPGHAGRLDYQRQVEETLDELASHLERHVDLGRIWEIAAHG